MPFLIYNFELLLVGGGEWVEWRSKSSASLTRPPGRVRVNLLMTRVNAGQKWFQTRLDPGFWAFGWILHDSQTNVSKFILRRSSFLLIRMPSSSFPLMSNLDNLLKLRGHWRQWSPCIWLNDSGSLSNLILWFISLLFHQQSLKIVSDGWWDFIFVKLHKVGQNGKMLLK